MVDQNKIQQILTTPPEITKHSSLSLTGNEYLSLPDIGPGGDIRSINVLHMGSRGLLEFSGGTEKPLLSPYLEVNGADFSDEITLSWRYHLDWLPCFEGCCGEILALKGELAFPPGHRGGCCRIFLSNQSDSPIRIRAGWQGCWSGFNHIIFNRREIKGDCFLNYDSWTKSLILEARSGLPLAALALSLEAQQPWQIGYAGPGSFRGAEDFKLAPGETVETTLYLAVNLEADGAGTTAVDLKRRGAIALIREAEDWLQPRRHEFEDPILTRVFHRNLFFNYFYALGRALDTDGLVPVTSRSPRYYVSAAFWSRDTLLWSFPGLLLADSGAARELLMTVFKRHLTRAGEHAHYIDGILLYPGFELDQLAAHFLALQRYENFTGDRSLLEDKIIARGLTVLAEKAEQHFDQKTGLYRTFLDPSDDPVIYPFLVYDNALLQRGFAYLGKLQAEERWRHSVDFNRKAEALQQAVYRHGTVKGPRGAMFAWAVDGCGKFQLYDNPPGSLQLLAYYGFCFSDDLIFKNTVSWIRSANNPYYHLGCVFEEAGSLHCDKPWPLAACNDLLSFNTGSEEFFRKAPLDNGFCCETIDPETGRAATGAAFASAAGFLAHALWFAKNRNGKIEADPGVSAEDEAK